MFLRNEEERDKKLKESERGENRLLYAKLSVKDNEKIAYFLAKNKPNLCVCINKQLCHKRR